MPRTGLAHRIDKYKLNLPKQSIYDHLITIAYNSDIVINTFQFSYDKLLLANFCVYHDIAETIIGDVPTFTSKELAEQTYMTKSQKKELEAKANHIILNSLTKKYCKPFKEAINLLSDEDNPNKKITSFFWMMDKIEPIIAIWRYIHLYKKLIDVDLFIEAMSDFFKNPRVIDYAIDNNFKKLIEFLQDKSQAKQYYLKDNDAFNNLDSNELKILLKYFIEYRNFHCI